jgi:hypothetical protein
MVLGRVFIKSRLAALPHQHCILRTHAQRANDKQEAVAYSQKRRQSAYRLGGVSSFHCHVGPPFEFV